MFQATDTVSPTAAVEPSRDASALDRGIYVHTLQMPTRSAHVPPGGRIPVEINTFARIGAPVAVRSILTLVRKPDESKLSRVDEAFVLDAPGLYIVDVELAGGWRRQLELVGVHPAMLDKIAKQGTVGVDRWAVLRSVLRDPQVTRATVVEALETGDPMFGLAGSLHGHPDHGINLRRHSA